MGGEFTLLIGETSIASHNFGTLAGGTYRKTLSGTYHATTSGLYIFKVRNTNTVTSSTCIYSYTDNISVTPADPDFRTDVVNIERFVGGTVNMALSPGPAHAGSDYWIWMSISGTCPGFDFSGINVPLNQDVLFQLGLMYPYFPGTTGFMGTLDGNGQATASIDMPTDRPYYLKDIPVNFAYVLLSPGPSGPITYASVPVHVKYTP